MSTRVCHPGRPDLNCPMCRASAKPGGGVREVVSRPAVFPTPLPVVSVPCIHEGAILEFCPTCGKSETAHVRDCDIHERCTRGTTKSGRYATCDTCPDYEHPDRPTPTVRHLAYHIYPVLGNDTWRINVDAVRSRLPLFNGRVVVAVAVDPPDGDKLPGPTADGPGGPHLMRGCAGYDAVVERFGDDARRIQFLRVVNDPNLREVATFAPMASILPCDDPTHVTLYAHAKGVTRPPGHPAHVWTEILYRLCMDYWPVVARQLKRYAVTGPFKKIGAGWPEHQSKSDWHYSGSWFWFRNHDLLRRSDWTRMDQFWSGIEPYPSLHYPAGDAGCIFHHGTVSDTNLYNNDFWRRVVLPNFNTWATAHVNERTVYDGL